MPSPTQRRGTVAEDLAERRLIQLGYTVVGRNVRAGGGELDIIAYDAEVLCFVEVRARRSTYQGDPVLTVGPKKQRRLVRAAQAYVARRRLQGAMRFDVVSVLLLPGLAPDIRLFANAFDVDGLPAF